MSSEHPHACLDDGQGESDSEEVPTPNGEAEEKAWEYLKQAAGSSATVVQLSSLGLARVPTRFMLSLTALQQLDLGGNALSALAPEAFAGCAASLREVRLQGNRLTRLPVSICSCDILEVLDCSSNHIAALPQGLGYLALLHTLNCAGNRLVELPVSVCEAIRLRRLTIAGNNLASLPADLGALPALVELDCSENGLTTLPEGLADAPRLKDLHAQGNPLTDKKQQKAADAGNTKELFKLLRGGVSKTQAKNRKGRNAGSSDNGESTNLRLWRVAPEDTKRVVLTRSAEGVRPFICCCVVHLGKDQRFDDQTLRAFIDAQQELHRTMGDKRRVACLGTHDLGSCDDTAQQTMRWPLQLAADQPGEVRFIPLREAGADSDECPAAKPEDAAEPLPVSEILSAWESDSRYRAYARRSVTGGKVAYLRDESGHVLSVYPVSNCRRTANSTSMQHFLLEVSSAVDASVCRDMCVALLRQTIQLLEAAAQPDDSQGGDSFLRIEPVDIVDERGRRRCRFPEVSDLRGLPGGEDE